MRPDDASHAANRSSALKTGLTASISVHSVPVRAAIVVRTNTPTESDTASVALARNEMTDAERIALAAQRCLETIREYAVRKESE
jgi:hypothetical protein